MKLTSIEAVFVSTFHALRLDFREISQKWSYWCWILARSTVNLADYCSQGDRSRAASCREQPV